jgi:hypothetical protein
MIQKHLFIFNLETNLDNPLLAFTHDWITSFSKKVEYIHVFSTHVGRFDLPNNVDVNELGGGSLLKKIQAIFRLGKASLAILNLRRESIVFHHMSTKTGVFPGIFIRILGVPQGLWYSHSAHPFSLHLASKIVNVIITSTSGAFPFKSSKVSYVGHGLEMSSALKVFDQMSPNRVGIVSLGRITRIKNLDKILLSVPKNINQFPISFIGPKDNNEDIESELKAIATKNKIKLEILPPIDHSSILKKLVSYSIYYSGTPKSVDKATIEAASVGCFVVTTESTAQVLTGMDLVWKELNKPNNLSLEQQVQILGDLTQLQDAKLRRLIHKQSVKKNDVTTTVSKILSKIVKSKL